ncbi:TnsD family Tn7-like transposition protein [Sessilibacter corallicola]|uniref:TnsD family Tn7-like transposition protein n=1 Tax=Sessilibacter corallicola TaxID=2904075 RepID=UPI003342D6CC
MIAYFPVPYQDELLCSVIARYAVHTGEDKKKVVVRELFGRASASIVSDFPSHIDILISQINQVYATTSENLIFNHTLAPIYFPFIPPESVKLVIKAMRSKNGSSIHTRVGISASSIKQPKFFRYCPLCVRDQTKSLGEPFWRRLHQISGVYNCPEHQCELNTSKLNFYQKNKYLFQALGRVSPSFPGQLVRPNVMELRISNLFKELLLVEPNNSSINFTQWSNFYYELAARNNLLNGNRVNHDEILSIIQSNFRATRLKDVIPKPEKDHSWLVNIFRKHRKSFNPLEHLMIWSVFTTNESVSQILERVKESPSKNIFCMSSHKKCISNSNEVKLHRRAWKKLIRENPEYGAKKLRSLSGGAKVYAWLYRNDYAWLSVNKPRRIKSATTSRIDYKKWDESLVAKLKVIKNLASGLSMRPRLSKTHYIKQLDRSSSIEKKLHLLPNTKLWLKVNSESVESYQKFRILSAVKILSDNDIEVNRWRVLRKAGLNSKKISMSVSNYINLHLR